MRDGRTTKLQKPAGAAGLGPFLQKFRASLVALAGCAEGSEIVLDQRRIALGRGPGVDAAFENRSMSKTHALIEFVGDGFQIRDLDSTNGVVVNGERVQSAELRHGDRFALGDQCFQLLIEEREARSPTYVLPEA
jgi:pSer/pThr/pTyr-binding forkhead associated (FHA) protein